MKMERFLLSALALLLTANLMAQQPKIQNFRPYDQEGINVFEPAKETDEPFEGLKVRVGGSFTQQYQAIEHSNQAEARMFTNPRDNKEYNLNELYNLGSGFNLAAANLNFDFQIEDGIRVSLENYMSSRHHPEFWVKGGYIQMDKLPMFGSPEWFSKYLRVKIGHFQINYGDQQFRRTDNGNAMYNPFVGNTIMDPFTTEIGGEVYLFATKNFMAMAGMTAGLINGDVFDYGEGNKRASIYGKLAYDNQINEDLRFRLSGSIYTNSNTPRNTLYGGDRTGSRFYFAMEPTFYLDPRAGNAFTTTTPANRFTSGRLDPGFSNEITSIMINPFIKFKGLELFGTYEIASGKRSAEADTRDFSQLSGELVYRFLPREQVFVGARYNSVNGRLRGLSEDISIDRIEVAAGWFPTKNLLLKAAYVNQTYNDYPTDNILHGGEFKGMVIEAVVGF
jgi:hypothetical protein